MLAVFYKERTHHILLANSLGLMWPCLSPSATPGPTGDPSTQQNQTPLTGAELKDASLSFMLINLGIRTAKKLGEDLKLPW